MDAIELEIGGGWIGSAYSPQVSVTDTEDGHRVEFTYDDAEDGISTVGYDVPDWSEDEEARKEAERQRQLAESERSQDEAQRASAERSRAQAESSRASAEESRASAEEAREGAEAARQAAFEQAEAQRAAGEQSRVQAESQRVSAETARQEAMAGAVERSQQAEQRADEAYQEASQATATASDAATRASASADQADQAATRAAASADAADASKSAADQATASANSAATAAGDAAQSATAAAQAAATATGNANAATANANDAAQSASASATAADTAAESANDASARAEAAIEAIGDISELAVPLMSADTRGGATLGQGLKVDGGALSIGDIVTDETDGPIYSVDAKGWAEQDGTPTPDNPQEVRVARGRNLLENTATTTTVSGVTFTVNEDKSVTANGTATAGIAFPISVVNMPDGNYVLSGCPANGSASTYRLSLAYHGYEYGAGLAVTGPVVNRVMTIAIANGYTCNNLTFYPQLERGSTPTPYVPYGHVGLEVQGANILDLTAYSLSTSSMSISGKQANKVNLNTTGSRYCFAQCAVTGFKVGDRYTLACDKSNSTFGAMIMSTSSGGTTYNSGVEFTATQESYYIRFYKASASSGDACVFSNVGIMRGSVAYQPYHHETRAIPLPLKSDGERWAGGLPDGTADVLSIDSAGGVEWTSAGICSLTFDGTQARSSWAIQTGTSGQKFLVYAGNGYPLPRDSALSNRLCDRFPIGNPYTDTGDCAWVYVSGSNTVFRFLKSGLESLDAWWEWFAQNPTTILYPLATPTTEHAYIDLPDVPEGSTIDIPELREVGVRCFVHGVSELIDHANNWGARCKQNESRIAALEAAIAELATS